jgi:hypothetical protein
VLAEATLKIVRAARGGLTLQPANPDDAPLVFKGAAHRRFGSDP